MSRKSIFGVTEVFQPPKGKVKSSGANRRSNKAMMQDQVREGVLQAFKLAKQNADIEEQHGAVRVIVKNGKPVE